MQFNIKRKYTMEWLVILNLIGILLFIINKFELPKEFFKVVISVMICPIIFAVFLFYILRPMNRLFLKKRLKKGSAAALTMLIFFFIMSGLLKYFGDYFVEQILTLKNMIMRIAEERDLVGKINEVMNGANKYDYFSVVLGQLQTYIVKIITNAKDIFNKGLGLFSNALLSVLILFYLLRDGEKVPEYIMKYTKEEYKRRMEDTLEDGDRVLSKYILGQTIVATTLAILIYIGYKIIDMPSAMILSTSTFILAFIPFVGFFVSMIVPFVIAITMGPTMIIKLTVLFLIAQTIKGRIVVPVIMGKTMKIHPITDIFLVVGAATIIGPIGAFIVVPVYALLKLIYKNFKPIKITDSD